MAEDGTRNNTSRSKSKKKNWRQRKKEQSLSFYVALRIRDPTVCAVVRKIQQRIALKVPALSGCTIPEEELHLTLVLLTNKDEEQVKKSFFDAQSDLDSCEQTKVHFAKSLGRFNDKDDELRVVFAALAQDSNQALQKLREKVVTHFAPHGVLSEHQSYKPHLTLLKTSRLPRGSPNRESISQLSHYFDTELQEIPDIFGDQSLDELELISFATGKTVARLEKNYSGLSTASKPQLPSFVDADGTEITVLPLPKRAPRSSKRKPLVLTTAFLKPKEKLAHTTRLFAYGEFMRLERFIKDGICGPARTASLPGWCLTFDARGGRENISPGQPTVRGVCYELTDEALDRVRKATKSLYSEVHLSCLQLDSGEPGHDCLVLLATQVMDTPCIHNILTSGPKPPLAFVKVLRDNARHFQLGAKYQRYLDELPTAQDRNKSYFKVHANPLLIDAATSHSNTDLVERDAALPSAPERVHRIKNKSAHLIKPSAGAVTSSDCCDSNDNKNSNSIPFTKRKEETTLPHASKQQQHRRRNRKHNRSDHHNNAVVQNDRY